MRKGTPGLVLALALLVGACAAESGQGGDACGAACVGDVPFEGLAGSAAPVTTGGAVDPSQSPSSTSTGPAPGTGAVDSGPAAIEPPPGAASGTAGAPADPGTAGTGAATPMPAGGCGQTLPPVSDYGANGPFATTTVNLTGPDGMYTMFRPTTLGEGGFLHPVATWGNGITTNPALYPGLLGAVASHGFVVIASNSSNVTPQLMTSGLDWLIAQNDAPGDFQGKLDTDCAVAIGYSLGGGGAVNTGSHPAVVATVSWHGLQGASEKLHGPLLLITSTNDGFVTKSGFVQPCYDRSSVVPTIMATLEVAGAASFAGHLIPLGDAGDERAPGIAWLRLWVYGDEGARPYFYGPDCTLCQSPWTDIQRKNADW